MTESADIIHKVLVVDDEPANCELLDALLSRAGYIVHRAESAAAAYAMLSEHAISLVLLDVLMPLEDGIVACAKMRERHPSIPIVIVTAMGERGMRRRALEAGADDMLTKPVDDLELVARVRSLLQVKSLRDARERMNVRLEADAMLRRVYEALGCGVIVLDREGSIIQCNAEAASIFGASMPEVEGRRIRDVVDPLRSDGTLLPEEERLLGRVIRTGQPERGLIMHFRRSDGETRWAQLDAVPLKGATGEVQLIVTTLIDVTALHLAEETLRRNERALRFLSTGLAHETGHRFFAATVRELAALTGLEVALVGVLPRGAPTRVRSLGLSVDGIEAPNLEFSVRRTVCEEVLRLGELSLREGVRTRFPTCELAGQLFVEGVAGVTLRDVRGEAVGILAVLSRRPIAHIERVESLLRLFAVRIGGELARQRTEARFSDLFEFAPEAILMVDGDGLISMANRQSARLFGASRDELVGSPVARHLPPGPPGPPDGSAAVAETTTSRKLRLDARRIDGSTFPAEIRLRPLASLEGTLIVTTVRDLTESLKAEERRKLLEAQLLQSQKMEAIGTMAGGIAHDFNNVLAAVIANVELGRANPSESAYLDEIHVAAQRATDLVRRILAFSREAEPSKHKISLARPVEEAVGLLRALIPRGVELSVELEVESPKVFADATQIHQVIMNLGMNAWHALGGQPGKITVIQDRVSVVAEDNPGQLGIGRYARIVVSDTGMGMAAATLERAFDPFFTTKPVGKGSGLGLSVVHGIMRDHGGTVTAESVLGEGAAFTLLLPIVSGPSDSDRPVADVELPVGNLRILCVDDEPALVRAATRLLQRLGYFVSGYSDPKEALRAVEAEPGDFDAVVVDGNMPGMSGIEFARVVHELRADLPILLVTGYFDEADRARAEAAGVLEIMEKPYSLASFSDAILRVAARGKP